MAGVKALRRIQYGQESTAAPGTKVAATGKLRMMGMLQDDRETVFAEETVGVLGGVDRAYCPKLLGSLELEGEATFEQATIIFGASIEDTTGVVDGAGSDYIYQFDAPTTAQNNVFTYTLEGGDDQACETMYYSYVTEWSLSGKYGEAWMLNSTWNGRTINDTDTFTASTDAPLYNVSEMLFGKTKLYIDDDSDAVGTTIKSNTLIEAELKYTSGWIPKYTADGELYFSFIECVGPEITLDITFEHDGTATAEKLKWKAGTARGIRLLIEGPAVTTGGTTYSAKRCQLDMMGKWEKFEKIDEVDGNDVVKGTLRCRYNSTRDLTFQAIVVNERVNF